MLGLEVNGQQEFNPGNQDDSAQRPVAAGLARRKSVQVSLGRLHGVLHLYAAHWNTTAPAGEPTVCPPRLGSLCTNAVRTASWRQPGATTILKHQ
jgi:hypothetical protein